MNTPDDTEFINRCQTATSNKNNILIMCVGLLYFIHFHVLLLYLYFKLFINNNHYSVLKTWNIALHFNT